MGLKVFTMEFAELANEKTFRDDVDFSYFQNDYNISNFFSFNDLFLIKKNNCVNISNFEDDFYYSEIGNVSKDGDVEPVKLNFNERTIEDEDYYKKIEKGDIIKVEENDILISKVRPNLKKYVFIDQSNKDFFYTSAFIHLQPKKLNKILFYALRTIFYNNLIAISRQGKGYPTLKEDDFQYLKFEKSLINKLSQNPQITTQIEQIEQKIKELKEQIQPAQTIINKVFAREFGFDFAKFEELKKHTIFSYDFVSFANNIDLRQSVKFHRIAGKFVLEQLKSKTNKKIKDFLSGPIVLGKGISPNEYDENGDVFYIAMSNIKNWQFETEEARTVSSLFSSTNKSKTVALNDILLARSGEGTIGKVALIDDESVEGIFADFTMRIRLKNYNYLFAYFYFRTTYFQYLVEINKKGLGNNTNIFPSQVQEFPLFDISLIEQQQLVNEIKAELDEQEKVKKTIAEERNKIDEIIENIIGDS
jgi:restriction endonuclease S subunit